jgi:hypothetical protein
MGKNLIQISSVIITTLHVAARSFPQVNVGGLLVHCPVGMLAILVIIRLG